jgi:hypothetical protein
VNGEVRAHAKSLNTPKRNQLINDALNERDEVTLCAILGGPPYLSGLTKAESQYFTPRFQDLTNPLLARRFDVLTKVREKVKKSFPIIELELWKSVGINRAQLDSLRKSSKAASDALIFKEFNVA